MTLTNHSGGADPVVVNPGFEGTSGWNEVAKAAFPATSMVREGADIADGRTGDHAYAISNHAHGYLKTDEMAVDYGVEYHLQAAIRGVLDAKVRISAAASSASERRLAALTFQPRVNWPITSWESVWTVTL